MRAARAIFPNGLGTYCYATAEQNEAARQRDWENVATLIDKETAAPELLEALELIAFHSFPDSTKSDTALTVNISRLNQVSEIARAAIAKATGN